MKKFLIIAFSIHLGLLGQSQATDGELIHLEDLPSASQGETLDSPMPPSESSDAEAQNGRVATDQQVNVVNVEETFFRVVRNADTGELERMPTSEARPGDLIEIVVTATNASSEALADVELTNTVPSGPVAFIEDSITVNQNNGIFRLSRNGQDFFPAEADIKADEIRFIQWIILRFPPSTTETLTYRIRISPSS